MAWKLAPALPALPEHEPTYDALEEVAIGRRLDLAAAGLRLASAERALGMKRRTRLLPGLSAGVEGERELDGERLVGPTIEFALPLFNQGQPELARLDAELRRANAQLEGLTTDIRSEVREARDSVLAARAAAEFYSKTLLPQRSLLLQETLLHYNAMQKSNYELLAAREQQLLAERESVEALRDYWIARTQLERAIGGSLPSATGGTTATRIEPQFLAANDEEVPKLP
jgi:outer membrane protein, heavy metal efflux system